MVASGKDSAEVVKFMTLLAKLKDWSDDDPDSLPGLANEDEKVKDLCLDLYFTAHYLELSERSHRELFTAPVDPKFVTLWRDFEDRYEAVLAGIFFTDLDPKFMEVSSANQAQGSPAGLNKANLQWELADDDASRQALQIERAIEFGHEQATQDWRDLPDEFRESIENGFAAWKRLKRDVGFDLRGVFRRRELVPFVLIPRHVAASYGNAERLSMLKNLLQAHDAFIFGAPFAGLALMRSTMETLLRYHYGAHGKTLEALIEHASTRLPRGVDSEALHRLRRLANETLHLKPDKDAAEDRAYPTGKRNRFATFCTASAYRRCAAAMATSLQMI
jgi:hypothetical protein